MCWLAKPVGTCRADHARAGVACTKNMLAKKIGSPEAKKSPRSKESPKKEAKESRPKKPQPKRSPPPPPSQQGGTDMRATFAKLRTCDACISAGFGWCPNLRKCGGFALRASAEGVIDGVIDHAAARHLRVRRRARELLQVVHHHASIGR